MTMTSSSVPTDLIPKHVRAARALLAWSQQELAKAAGVATSTVADFERGQRTPVANNAQAIRSALEGAGIRFLRNGAVMGPAVSSLNALSGPGVPVRWVSAEDLSDWANRTDGAISLPTLVAHLIQATAGTSVRLRFPSDEGVRYPGWDGCTFSEVGNTYVPTGHVGWEVGSQRSNVEQKAATDYQKRTKAPGQLDPASSTYVFVTPRHWSKKDEWAKARQEEGPWREVRVYDADDLVHWIEQAPAVGLWLAVRLGKRPQGTRELEEVWEEWSLATKWPLTAELVLSDRDQDAAEVLRWLRGVPSVLSLQATTTDEVVAFFHATLGELPDDISEVYRARCLVATTAAAARALANTPARLLLVLTDPEPGLAQTLAQRGHHVLLAYDERPVARGEVRMLARPSRDGITHALVAAGIAEPRAGALARDSARNLTVLRRLIPRAPEGLPKWAEDSPPRALLAALLAGGWDEDIDADRARLSEIAGEPYETIAVALATYIREFDSPLQKVGSTWRIASPQDAWIQLAHNLTLADITRFEMVALAVLGAEDPRFGLVPDQRWMAPVRGIRPACSAVLRHGIGQVLILIAIWGDRVRTVPYARRQADVIVGKLLQGADKGRWWSLSRDFRLLAEASPGAFLTAIEDSLDQDDPPIKALFGHDDNGLFGTEHLSDLMWALESLAWSPEWMPRVTHVLARLDAIDIQSRRYVNGPANSLRHIHLLWQPQTFATLDQRLRALDRIRKRETDAAWKLMLGILPRGHDTSHPSPKPRWRDFTIDTVEPVTWGLVGRGAAEISERLLSDVGVNPARWLLLLDRLTDLAPDPARALVALHAVEPQLTKQSDRLAFWDKLRALLHHHRAYPDTKWSLPEAVLDRLEAVYDRFEPSDAIERTAWLFQHAVQLPTPSTTGWQAEQRDIDAARQRAVRTLYASGGESAVLSLARLTDAGGYIGKALYDIGLQATDIDALLETAVRSDEVRERNVAHGLIVSVFQDRKEGWAIDLIAKARTGNWGDTALLTILRALPLERRTWDLAAQIGGEIESTYWRQAPAFWGSENSEDIAYAIRMLISVGSARRALPLAHRGKDLQLPSDLLIDLLREAARQPPESPGDSNEATMSQHYVAEVLKVLDGRSDVDQDSLIALEWTYLQLLQDSSRRPIALLKALSDRPSLFIQMLSAVFNPSDESGVIEPEPEDMEKAKAIATQAYGLLERWDRIPGTREDGMIDGVALEAWVKEARILAKAAGREDIALHRIGKVLSASPIGADGNWPAEPIREVIDLFRDKSMVEGFRMGRYNRRGVTVRMPRDGGELERREAEKYRAWAKAIVYDHPHTAKVLDMLADGYDRDARREDDDAERLDWEP